MRLGGTDAQTVFRKRVRSFITACDAPRRSHTGVRAPEGATFTAVRRWTAQLFEAQLLGIGWPAEYGGRPDAEPWESSVVLEELAMAGVWPPLGFLTLAAGAIIGHGTKEQKDYYLPRIRRVDDVWCQLFSEPGAGSDLASLRTRAVRDGDDFVVNGQKIWTTMGHLASRGYLLARTGSEDSHHDGITAFALDMTTPGITVQPVREITGTSDFNQVFFDDVRIPASSVIGKVNDGWRVARQSLVQERQHTGGYGVEMFAMRDRLAELAFTPDGQPRQPGGLSLADFGRLAIDIEVNYLLSSYVSSRAQDGTSDAADAPISKVFFGDLFVELTEAGLAAQAQRGILAYPDPAAAADGWWQDAFLYARAYTISGGSNEILRNLIAERALGLPKANARPVAG